MQTEVLTGLAAIARAVELLRAGEVVALPTETVYGLAADARNEIAVAKIFEAKERPRFDPLIVHLPAREALSEVAQDEPNLVRKLIEQFWPGPLTVVLEKRETIPDIVTAGLSSVAVRMSADPVFQEVVSAFAGMVAAPSANRFGRISPTTAQHVYEELAGRIPLIVDGGATEHGLESTIVRVAANEIEILRAGPITAEMLREFGAVRSQAGGGPIIAPGQLPAHYAPRTKLMLVDDLRSFSVPMDKRVGALLLSSRAERSAVEGSRGDTSKVTQRDPSASLGMTRMRCLSERGDLREAAANLFRMLRELDGENLDLIVAESVPREGIGIAINDRLQRAAAQTCHPEPSEAQPRNPGGMP